jgi:acyl-CoA synthetase (AMP-forming)/AMP-acid ligase II
MNRTQPAPDVYSEVLASCARWPGRRLLVDGEGAVTAGELAQRIVALRDRLEVAGVGPGHGLGVLARNGRDFVAGVIAGLGTGAVVLPLAPELTRAELDRVLAVAPLHAVLDDRSGVEPVPGGRAVALGTWRFAATERPADEAFAPHVPDAAFVRFTSGTTGTSKGVVISHGAVLARTEAAVQGLGLGADDVVLWVLPMAYHFVVSVVAYVRFGIPFVVVRDPLARTILEAAAAHGGTLLYAAPTQIRMLAADASGLGLPAGCRVVATSAAVPRDVAVAFRARFGLAVSQVYGVIEVGLPLGNLDAAGVRPEAIGRALPGYEVAILGDDDVAVPDGAVGQLAVRGPGMFDAYLAPPVARDAVLRDGWFLTGDLAVREPDGLVVLAGRRKAMINVAGIKVFAEEVEAVLDAHPSVARSRVRAEAHPVYGEVVVAEVVAESGEAVDPDAVRRWARERLSVPKVPQRIAVVDAIPTTATGKIARAG